MLTHDAVFPASAEHEGLLRLDAPLKVARIIVVGVAIDLFRTDGRFFRLLSFIAFRVLDHESFSCFILR